MNLSMVHSAIEAPCSLCDCKSAARYIWAAEGAEGGCPHMSRDSGAFDHSCEQQGSARQFGDDDVFVDGVGAFADAAQAVERGDADAGGEVSVRTAADGGFLELPINLVGDGLRFLVEGGDSGSALHRQTVNAAFDAEFAVLVEGLQGAEFSVEGGGLLGALDAHVDFCDGFGGDDVGARSSANHAGID